MRPVFLIIVFFTMLGLSAQEIKDLSHIKGTAYVSGDISPNAAKQQAINDAKLNALKAAGIEEQFSSYQLLFSSQVKNDFKQFFSSDSQSELQGAIKSYSVTEENLYCKSNFVIVYDVTIDASVIRYHTKPDPAFDMQISGIKAAYLNGENLQFTLQSTLDAHLHVFNITDKEASLLIPNPYEKSTQVVKLKTYPFPMAKIDYALGNANKEPETNRLIFVLTKSDIPFIKMDKKQICSKEDIFSWIYGIPPDQRKVVYLAFQVN